MYIPESFKITDLNEIEAFLQNNSFGTLIHSGDSEPLATHLPFLIERKDDVFTLEGHIAIQNDQSKFLRKGKSVLVTFLGATGYISSAVYGHANVPTYNYQAVHVYGVVHPMSNNELVTHLNKMVSKHEENRCPSLKMENLPLEMLETYYKEITGFKIESYKVEAAFKLSQNRNDSDFESILTDIAKDPKKKDLFEAMKKNQKST
jgi:transcriptional regulator